MSELISIRKMQESDFDRVSALQKVLFPNDTTDLSRRGAGRDDFLDTVLVAVLDEKIVGFAVMSNRPWRFWTSVEFFGVIPEFSDQGIGRTLLDTVILHTRRRFLTLLCPLSNVKALTLYRTGGFRDLRLRKRDYSSGDDAVVMMKWLGSRNPGKHQ